MAANCTYHYYQRSVYIGGHAVTVETYVPNGSKRHPLVFMLHGSEGVFTLESKSEPPRDNFGEKTLARSCFVVVLPHYLEAFGYKSLIARQDIIALFPQLFLVANNLLEKAEALPSVRGQPVFLFGESLGAYLCLALALRHSEVKAVSEISGGIPEGYSANKPHPVAVLISHGADDKLVPVNEARKLEQYCNRHNLRVEMDLYRGTGHYFSSAIEAKCVGRTIEFFQMIDNRG